MTLLQARIWSGFVTSMGVIGFVGLLVASGLLPDEATFLRTVAFAWFLAFGIAGIAVRHRTKRSGRKMERPAKRSIKPQPR
ncbi:MAG: hypothetical protein EPO41_28445 [Reyranella sp.]|uniref:hypothetical protein n=1 Tax=Reyranella sp. TaxID=1929291 RepID=UPI0011FFBAA4|nr:hypothetical protein [Reyranella sp.]TAJ85043.1 MAG: hypothetical protein EPO41_28445 [Reyranella sp.]